MSILELELRGAVGSLCDALESGDMPPEALLVGAAGSGKTWGILVLLHLLSLRRPGLRILVCRKTREALTESVLVTYEKDVLPLTGSQRIADGIKRRVRQSYVYPNGTEWIVGGLDKPSKILSTSYDLVFPNEAIELDEEDWETLQSRIGRPERSHGLNALVGDTNPGNPSHWLKARCDDGRCREWPSRHADNPAMHDGRGWTEAGKAYLTRLKRLTGTRRKRLFEGVWAAGEGQWFSMFDTDKHVSARAEFDTRWPVHLAVDTGVHTGAVLFQVHDTSDGPEVNVFGDYYSYDVPARNNALAIQGLLRKLCRGRFDVGRYDPAGGAKAGFGGQTIATEFESVGLRLQPWLKYPGCVLAGLSLIESFVALDSPKLLLHPRCTHLINAFANYRRKKSGTQFVDEPESDQHPYSDVMDPLRSALLDRFPDGRRPEPPLRWRPAPGGRFR
jgi:hypothetical protein